MDASVFSGDRSETCAAEELRVRPRYIDFVDFSPIGLLGRTSATNRLPMPSTPI